VLVLIAMIACGLVATSGARAGAVTSRVPVILDLEAYASADDAGAEAAMFAMSLTGLDNVVAIGVSTPYYRPEVSTVAWQCVAAIAQFYGYPNVPIGSDMPDSAPPPPTSDFLSPCAALASANTPAPAPAVQVYRKALASQPDGSVVMVGTGYEENIDALLNSPPDSISPLTGSQLVAQKVKELVLMGGGYPSRNGEDNFAGHAGAAGDIAAHWPTKIVYDGYEVGQQVFTGQTVTTHHPADSPVRALIHAYAGNGKAIASFDLTTIYHAIIPTDPYMSEVGPGTNSIDNAGHNTFTTGTGNEWYLSLPSSNVSGLDSSIESLWDTLPGTTPQPITFSPPPQSPTVGGTYQASASGGATGNPVTISIDLASTSGCTIDGSNLVTFSAPSGTCVIDANQPGDTTYAPGAAKQTLNVAGITQTITFTSTPPSSPTVGGSYAASASGGASQNPVVISIDATSTSGCTIDGSGNVTFSAPRGTCVIDANQAGNSTYATAKQVQQTIGVGGITQTVSFTSTPPSPTRVGTPAYTPTATSSSGLGVTFSLASKSTGCTLSSGHVIFSGVGTCLVDATQAGNATYLPASQQQSIHVAKGASKITITSRSPKTVRAGTSYRPAAKSNSGDKLRISLGSHSKGCALVHGIVQFRAVGTCIINFTDAGNANYARSTVSQVLSIVKGRVTLKVGASPGAAPSGSVISLRAKASVTYATGSVTFTSRGKSLCAATVRNGIATCRTSVNLPRGSYRVMAGYSGSASFAATTSSTVIRTT